ncbi:MAG TPA: ATP-binding protein [Halomicronema sp.]
MNFKFSQKPISNLIKSFLPSSAKNRFLGLIASLSVGQKITFGYAVALSIAALGTTIGITIAQWYQEQSHIKATNEHEAGIFLVSLEAQLLQIRSHHQRLALTLNEPQEYQRQYQYLLSHQNKLQLILDKLKGERHSEDSEWKPIIKSYIPIIKNYLNQGEIILKKIDNSSKEPLTIAAIQKEYSKFNIGENAEKIDHIIHEISNFSVQEFKEEMQAEKNLQQAEAVQKQILISSLVLSIIIGAILAYHITRAIVLPIKAVTEVAKKVTAEANFEEKAPITTDDEIGSLADSLNQLIAKVKQLLDEQKAATTSLLLQNEKMASLGRMVAGIAHEINNPVNFIYANLSPANQYIQDLLELLETYNKEVPSPPLAVRNYAEEIDIEFIKEDLPKLIKSMDVGAARVREIILSLKNFSRLDEAQPGEVDLNECLRSTLLILNNRLKKGINLVCNYDGNLSHIEGYSGFLSQVFMNIISNAIEAVEENKNSEKKQIIISTKTIENHWVEVQISDNGTGISPENLSKIFNEFFTTKPLGIGTGLGLTISYQIITQKHGGKISCQSELNKGTTFTIKLPVKREINY